MEILISIVHVLVCLFLILAVLLQAGRGGGLGAGFGGGTGAQVFGGRGAGGFLRQITTAAAVVFFLTSITLSVLSSRRESVVGRQAPASDTTGVVSEEGQAEAAPEDASTDEAAQPEAPASDEPVPDANEGLPGDAPPASEGDAGTQPSNAPQP